MTPLSEISKSLALVIGERWPGVSIDVRFRPLLDLDLGDVGTDAPIRLGAMLGQSPSQLALEIIRDWQLPHQLQAFEIRGYINLRFEGDPQDILCVEPQGTDSSSNAVIQVVPPASRDGGLALLRIAATAYTQHLLRLRAGLQSEFRFADLAHGFSTKQANEAVARQILTYSAQQFDAAFMRQSVARFSSEESTDSLGFLWILPGTLPKGELAAQLQGREEKVQIFSPAGPWVDFRFHEEHVADFLRWTDDQISCLFWYLASANAASEIDFMTPLNAENANLAWYLRQTYARTERLVSQSLRAQGEPKEQTLRMAPQLRRLGIRSRFLPTFLSCACDEGEVGNYVAALTDTLHAFNRILNDPDFRIRLDQGKMTEYETKIIAGAGRSLSDSINACDLHSKR